MQLISCHDGKIHALHDGELRAASPAGSFRTGLRDLDAIAPGGAFARGAVHELLTPAGDERPLFAATLLAKSATKDMGHDDLATGGWSRSELLRTEGAPSSIVWLDPHRDLYPPALAAHGIDLDQVYLVRSRIAEQAWAMAECLRCRGLGAIVAAPPRLSRVDARRLQLAAEQGGTVGLLMRTAGRESAEYAAATRWLVTPAPGERTIQRWKMELIHGHGGRVGESVVLEYNRETHTVRTSEKLADRPRQPAAREGAGVALAV